MSWTTSRRALLILVLAVPLAGVLLYLNTRRPVPQVAVAQVTRRDLSSSITSNGKVEPITPHPLRAKFDGFVNRIEVSENQTVRAGQLLMTLDDTDIRSQLDQTRAQLAAEEDKLRAAQAGGPVGEAARVANELRAAEAQHQLLERQQGALEKLFAQKAATSDELEKNRTALERANAEVDQLRKAKQQFDQQVQSDRQRLLLSVSHLRAEAQALQERVNSARLRAAADGALVSLPVRARDYVHTGDLLAEVADLSQLRVRAYIDEPELGQLQPNQPVEITWDALPGRTWTGRTESLPRQVVARGARNVGEVLCSISNDQMQLIPNTTVDVHIMLQMRPQVLTVPRGAVEIDGPRRYVYTINNGRLQRREVKVGIMNVTEYEIISGLQEGEMVALPGGTPLKDDQAVSVVASQ
jgi:HlyD family secretion protein